ncbi:MAG: DUF996 domain-containing protein [Candidatus Bathyarchaeota archaeon]|nr:MAG: DUF996 domain-containing protein [Candidatus Bathyarchaeota archaeon]
MNMETSKNLGAVGAILLVVSFLGFLGSAWAGLLGLIGIILVLIAMKGLSDYYNEGGIFNNALYSIITIIVGAVVFIGAIIATAFAFLAELGLDLADLASLGEGWTAIGENLADLSSFWTLLEGLVLSLVVLFVFAVIAAILYRKSLNLLAAKTGIGTFSTAGLLFLIGAVLTIILIGFLLIWVSLILLCIAFFRIRGAPAAEIQTQPPPPPEPPS